MSETLTSLVTRIQAQLLDDGTLFTTATITAGIRQALAEFNRRAPINGAELVEVDSTLQSYELTGGSFPDLILDVLDVLKNDEDGDDDEPLEYTNTFEDNRNWVRLVTKETSGNLLVRFTQPHTLSGLDSETASTMNTDQDQILVDGAAAFSINIRLMKPIESINLNKPQIIIDSYEKAAIRYMDVFHIGLSRYSRRPLPQSEENTQQWELDD